METALVSVIIPTFNRERYLKEAIASVLNQTLLPFEVIVLDDGSTDDTAAIVKQFPSVRYYCQTNRGAAAARNQGVELAQGNFLTFLDSDDLWAKDKLAWQLATFEANPDLDAVFGHVQQFHSPELNETARQKIKIPVEVMPGYHVGIMMIRREAFLRVGFFDTELRVGEFIAWYARATDMGLKTVMLPEVVMHRRLHDTNLGISQRDARTDFARILKTSLDRKRAVGPAKGI